MLRAQDHTLFILAGGQSRRMGRDKGELQIGGQRMIERVIARTEHQCSDIVISGSHSYALYLRHVPDWVDGPGGPAGGIYAGFRDETITIGAALGFFTAPIDGPMVPLNLTQRLFNPMSSQIARDNKGRHPAFGWWRFEDVSRAFQNYDFQYSLSLNALAEMCGARCVDWAGEYAFVNLNTPQDLEDFNDG